VWLRNVVLVEDLDFTHHEKSETSLTLRTRCSPAHSRRSKPTYERAAVDPTDTCYGGGEWAVLAGWLAWHYARTRKRAAAQQLQNWIEDQADAEGNLPEQVSHSLNKPDRQQEWVDRWGTVAQPLLWSHANYLIAQHHLNGRE